MFLRQITDPALAQNAYLLGCQKTGQAVVVDPQRDVDRYLEIAASQDLEIVATVDTHLHADYLSGSRELLERHGVKGYFPGEGGPDWQFEWAQGLPNVHFLKDGDVFKIGGIELHARFTPGHTPEHVALVVTDTGSGSALPIALLSGDFIFVGDVGRPDLLESAAGQTGAQEPAAHQLYESLRATSSLPAHLQILPAHGAGSSCGKALGAIPSSVLAYERETNSALRLAAANDPAPFIREILSGQPEPPLYFARMKRDNRSGPALLKDGKLPEPHRIVGTDLAAWTDDSSRVILDLRSDRKAFAERHLRGALFTPVAKGKLPSVAGSYVKEDAVILLLADADQIDGAVRQLIRIGLDRVEAWIPPGEALSAVALTTSIFRIETADLQEALQRTPDARVLDVRGAGEFAESHVKDALHIAHTRLAARLGEIDPTATWFVHCGSGLRAAFAAAFLSGEGRKVVYVDGDFEDISPALLET